MTWHARPADEAARELGTDLERGLTALEAAARLARHGPNELDATPRTPAWRILLHQFSGLIVILLLAAAGVALLMGELIEAVAILIVIVLNAVIGFATEWKANTALEALRKQVVPVTRVRRDGGESQVEARTLVPGDVVLLAAGDRVPSDGRVAQSVRLQVDESSLTGESVPVTKDPAPVTEDGAALGDRTSMVHLGSVVTDGRGTVIVTATGAATEMGKIGTMLGEVSDRRTPLEGKLAQLSRALVVVVGVLCAIIVVAGWLRGNDLLYMVEVGISLAIAAVPEGLLAVTTMTLAIGMQRMARMNALVRRLAAVESLGSTTVICTDKTGTLTQNEMTVLAMHVGDRRVEVGTGIDAAGDEALLTALRIGALCNDARFAEDGTALGDPTEIALVAAAQKAGLRQDALTREYPRTGEIPFDSESKRMVTVHRAPGGGGIAFAKGSPAAMLGISDTVLGADGTSTSPLTEEMREGWRRINEELAGQALRLIALAQKPLSSAEGNEEATLTRDLTFVGLTGMIDPLREGVVDTIATCRQAGIRTIMITGDQALTAAEIARQLGIDKDADGKALKAVHARELEGLDAAGWQAVVRETAVFARVSPAHKLRIVEALQAQSQVVAMTGDGVNDAPALKTADIGIAMGIRGTDVAKEASDMVITDDDFSTIVGAVEQGRVIVNNILRFIHYLFSCNFAEIMTVFIAMMVGWPVPLGVLQILWLNMITDIFPALALALEPSAPDVMRRPPRDPDEPLMTPAFGWLIAWQGALLAGSTLGAFAVGMRWYGDAGAGLAHAVTIAFMTLALAQVVHAFNARSRLQSAFTRIFSNGWLWAAVTACVGLQLAAVYVPWLRRVLRTTPLTLTDWGLIALASVVPVVVVEAVKAVRRTRQGGQRHPRR